MSGLDIAENADRLVVRQDRYGWQIGIADDPFQAAPRLKLNKLGDDVTRHLTALQEKANLYVSVSQHLASQIAYDIRNSRIFGFAKRAYFQPEHSTLLTEAVP